MDKTADLINTANTRRFHLATARAELGRRLRKWRRAAGHALYMSVAALLMLAPVSGHAAPLNLSQVPLFMSNNVQPNIMFLLDDSGSMDWEYTPNNGAPTINWISTLDLSPGTNNGLRLELCPGYNVQAYDPNVTYDHWRGVDINGNPYQDAHLMEGGGFTQIRLNPYCPNGVGTDICGGGNSGVRDLTALIGANDFLYFPWNDNSGGSANGRYETGECDTSTAAGKKWNDLTAAQKVNYANWYSYYRKREYVLKRAVSQLVDTSQHRMGLATLWNNSSVGTIIKDVDDISVPVNATAQTNKSQLLRAVSRMDSNNSTPLRTRLNWAGQYFRGSAPNTLFGFNPNHPEGFVSGSPILNQAQGGECQQNFAVVMTDGYMNGGSPGVGDTDSVSDTAYDGGSYAESPAQGNNLADVAMEYYEDDLAPALADNVRSAGIDTAPHQHLVTYTVAFGLSGSLDVNGPQPGETTFPGWPVVNQGAEDATSIDDLWHAAYNGRGQYLSARNPQQLISSLNEALSDIDDRLGSASAVTLNSGSISTQSRIYQARFNSGSWWGEILAKRFDVNTTVNPPVRTIVDANDWGGGSTNNIAEILEGQNWDSGRNIITHNGTSGAAFRWADLSTAQQTALINGDVTGAGTPDTTRGQNRLNYIRGDHSLEDPNGSFRTRSRTNSAGTVVPYVLGDIVHSSPQYIGAPSFGFPSYLETVDYNSFRIAQSSREHMIYVGANDGMLHGFSAVTGKEHIAYVPRAVYDNLAALPDQRYSHKYYVDETPVVGDVFFGGAWHTVLIGTLRGGGQGIFALDITDPTAFSEGNASNLVLWDYTSSDSAFADLGYTYGRPSIAKMQDGDWYAVFGNGFNNTGTGTAVLYLVNIGTGNVTRLDTGIGDTTTPNALSTPALVDYNGDYMADFAYAGDLRGNLWKFDLNSNSSGSWKPAGSSTACGAGCRYYTPLFTARIPGYSSTTDLTQRQPILVEPEVGRAHDSNDGFMIYFGTGKYLENTDLTSTPVQSFYGIWDRSAPSNNSLQPVSSSNLLSQTINYQAGPPETRTLSNNTLGAWGTNTGEYLGWRVNMPETRERIIADPVILDDAIFFVTITPDPQPCESGGTSWLMLLNLRDGGISTTSGFDIDGDGEIDSVLVGGQNANVQGTRSGDGSSNPGIVFQTPEPVDDPGYINVGGSVKADCTIKGTQSAITSDSQGNLGRTGLNTSDKSFRQSWRQVR